MATEAGLKPDELERLFAPPAKMDFGTRQRLTLQSIMRIGGSGRCRAGHPAPQRRRA